VLNPASIEFNSFSSRTPYISYPSGAFIPVFLFAKTFGIKDLIMLYQAYNLLNHLVISMMLFLLMFMIIDYFQKINILNVFFSIIPSLIYLFTPPTLYWHQNVFFADQAVIMWFAVFIYIEMKYFLYGKLNWLNEIVLAAIVFLGVLTDWLFVFVVFVAVGLRIFFANRARWFRQIILSVRNIIIPALLAIAVFIYQIASTKSFLKLTEIFKCRYRVGGDGVVTDFLRQYFYDYVIGGYGYILCLFAVFCILVLLFYYIFMRLKVICNHNDKMVKVYIYLICFTALPCLFHGYIFQQHSIVHDFAALKWALPLSLIPFGIFPIVFIKVVKRNKHHELFTGIFCVFCIILLVRGVFYRTAVEYRNFFESGGDRNKRIGELVKRNATYNDICFSFDFAIPMFPPQRLAYSGKRVYKIEDIAEAKDMLSEFAKRGARAKIFIDEKKWDDMREDIEKVCSKIYKDSDYYVCETETNRKE